MKNTNPLVSIIIPVYNTEKFVKEAIDSALGQTYHNIEVIAVDDGSTDCSLEIMKNINEPRFRYYSQMNQGACVARNRGIQESKGEYLKFLDADDILYPDCIEKHIKHYQILNDEEISFGSCNQYKEYEDKCNHIDTPTEYYSYLEKHNLLTSSSLYRRQQILYINGFDVKLDFGQESDLNIRLINKYKFRYSQFIAYKYRYLINENSISSRPRTFSTLIYMYEKLVHTLSEQQLAFWCIYAANSPFHTPSPMNATYLYKLGRKHIKAWKLPKFNNSKTLGIISFYLSYLLPYGIVRSILIKVQRTITNNLYKKNHSC